MRNMHCDIMSKMVL